MKTKIMICIISGIAKAEIEIALNNYKFGNKHIRTFKESLFDISGNIRNYGKQIAKLFDDFKIIKISKKLFLYKTDNKYVRIDVSLNCHYNYIFKIQVYEN